MWKFLQSGFSSICSHGWDFSRCCYPWSLGRQMRKKENLVHFVHRACFIWLCKFICSNVQNICFIAIFDWILHWWWNIICLCLGNRTDWSVLQRVCWHYGAMFLYLWAFNSPNCCIFNSWLEDIVCSSVFAILCFYIIF